MNNVSFIISIDSSYEMTNNFFEELLKTNFAKESEIIIILDYVDNINILNYLNRIKRINHNISIIVLDKKVGYGVANNIGVNASSNKYLFFINTDVFVDDVCLNKMLRALESNQADCVQPLLIWPQNNRIQCAGSFFGPFYKNHLFAGRKTDSIDFDIIPIRRQALTSALYAMSKDTFNEHGKFDEFYYNKLESFELSVKLTLAGKKCVCLQDAVAYHSQGAGRNQYYFDFYQQEAYFWTNFGKKVSPDIIEYFKYQTDENMKGQIYVAIVISQTRGVRELIDSIDFTISNYIEINGVNPNRINLYDLLPYSIHCSELPLLFFVENIMNLLGNQKWFDSRNANDIVLDTYGNLLYIKDV